MEYQKIESLLDNETNQPSKFRAKNSIGTYTGSNIKFKTTMLRSNLYDYADAYILVNGRITITRAGNDDATRRADERDKGIIFKNCASFTKCISRINNTEMDNAQNIDIVMPMYNLIEYSDNYSETSGNLQQYYKDEPNDNTADSESFKSKAKTTEKSPNDRNTKDVEIIVPLKYLSKFWRTLEMPLINCEVNLILTWCRACVIANSNGGGKFAINETKESPNDRNTKDVEIIVPLKYLSKFGELLKCC